eukprot:TRINITY_DN6048_c0_g1_i1.p1 TRINITY_DN6048_c0_g1~~TRINITY_DN6048_c0_g1_i1.p1  ORF type:complete len:589 (-),score=143.10 TRINITY_DN6048_c0_g1_i1:136-1902(-)
MSNTDASFVLNPFVVEKGVDELCWLLRIDALPQYLLSKVRAGSRVSSGSFDAELEELRSHLPLNISPCGLVISQSAPASAPDAKLTEVSRQLKANASTSDFFILQFQAQTSSPSGLNGLIYRNGEASQVSLRLDENFTLLSERSSELITLVLSVTLDTRVVDAASKDPNLLDSIEKVFRLRFAGLQTFVPLNRISDCKDSLKDFVKSARREAKGLRTTIIQPFAAPLHIDCTLLLDSSAPALQSAAKSPLLTLGPGKSAEVSRIEIPVIFAFDDLTKLLVEDLTPRLTSVLQRLSAVRSATRGHTQSHFLTFRNDFFPHAIGAALCFDENKDWSNLRRSIHEKFFLPTDRPLLALQRSLGFQSASDWIPYFGTGKLRNPHLYLGQRKSHTVAGGKKSIVDGSYTYFHYLQDGASDDGWGCAYRSLQTVLGWFIEEGYVRPFKIPTHREIQTILFELGDKPREFIGTSEWIGAIEVSYVINRLLNLECKTLFVSNGAEITSYVKEFADHFESNGSPVMFGGGVLAFTLLGVDRNETTGEVRFLILDPHYTGSDVIEKAVDKGAIAWKGPEIFLPGTYYNFCLVQRPNRI